MDGVSCFIPACICKLRWIAQHKQQLDCFLYNPLQIRSPLFVSYLIIWHIYQFRLTSMKILMSPVYQFTLGLQIAEKMAIILKWVPVSHTFLSPCLWVFTNNTFLINAQFVIFCLVQKGNLKPLMKSNFINIMIKMCKCKCKCKIYCNAICCQSLSICGSIHTTITWHFVKYRFIDKGWHNFPVFHIVM